MYFSKFSDRHVFLKAGNQPPARGFLNGLIAGHTVSLNPALHPNKELIWYIVNLERGQELGWLNRNRILESQLGLVQPFHQIDFDLLRRETRKWNRENPVPDDLREYVHPALSGFFYFEDDTYQDKLKSFEWQKKRLDIFEKNRYQCANPECKVSGTFTLVMGKSQSAFRHYKISDFFNRRNAGDIRWNSISNAINFFGSLRLPFITLTNFPYARTSNSRVVLELHHTYYIMGKKPWDYDDSCFKPLCRPCHEEVHRNLEIPVYEDENMMLEAYATISKCNRCNGEGYISRFNHVQNGICFKCWGDGYACY